MINIVDRKYKPPFSECATVLVASNCSRIRDWWSGILVVAEGPLLAVSSYSP